MPRLSLYRPNRTRDYQFLDRTISEMYTVGGMDIYVHKYMGPQAGGQDSALSGNADATQPTYEDVNVLNIQDLLLLENRDRIYDQDIYVMRGVYRSQDVDFDLTQFGLFLNNDIIFIVVHYNDMIDIMGRKLMVGDVIELPHLLDFNPLDEKIPTALKRFYQVTDANFASEGFTQTWYPHLWRIKCEKLVASEEFSQILQEPTNQDNYLGLWDKDKTYPPGYVITFGDKNYISKTDVPIGVSPPNDTYWELDTNQTLTDILSTYNKNIAINNAALEEAKRIVPKSGYDTSELYIVPTYGPWNQQGTPDKMYGQPAPATNVVIGGQSQPATGTVSLIRNSKYKKDSQKEKSCSSSFHLIRRGLLSKSWKFFQ